MSIDNSQVLAALSHVQEPDLKKDLVTLNMIRDVRIEGKVIFFTVVLTTPACPLKERIRQDCEDAIHSHIGKEYEAHIHMTAEVTSIFQTNTPNLPKVKNVIAIASGKGGVGKSTVTANLAMALHLSGATVGVLDADISGPSQPLMFGVQDEKPFVEIIEGKNMIVPIDKGGIKIISMGFLAPAESAIVWRGPMASKALMQFITDTLWGELDYLLVDLPPGTGDIHLTLVNPTIPLTGAVLVTTPQKVALADVLKGAAMFRQPQINVPILGLVENMAYFVPAELPENKYYIFGKDGGKEFAQNNVIPFLGQIPIVQSIREGGDNGVPAVLNADETTRQAFREVAENLARQVAIRNAEKIQEV
jgi:ATP-binding protein involved in chromosome partitioning